MNEERKENEALKKNEEESRKMWMQKVDNLSKALGMEESDKTIFEIRDTDDPNVKELVKLRGEWNADRPMFAYHDHDPKELYVFLGADTFGALVKALKEANEENFNLKLEKAIMRHLPEDYEDVRLVAMDRIKDLIAKKAKDGKPLQLNLDEIVSEIKRKHPSLFINLKELLGEGNAES